MNAAQPDKTTLTLRRAFQGDARARSSMSALLRAVFDLRLPAWAVLETPWVPFAFFDEGGCCVASLEVGVLPLMVDGQRAATTGIRSVAVHPDWRGRGLFRDLMIEAIAWCDARSSSPLLLYSAEPKLYERLGFRLLPQHAFSGVPPQPLAAQPARAISLEDAGDRALVLRLLHARTPVSFQCGIIGGASRFLANVATGEDLVLAYGPEHDALIVYESADDGLVLVDVVAAAIPSMATILAILAARPMRVTTLFPPDRLDWHGEPVLDDTGLMVRGVIPPAMERPFMLPPTAEF